MHRGEGDVAVERFPIGRTVRVVKSDLDEYVGARGVVVGYDVGDAETDMCLTVLVKFPTDVADATAHNDFTDGFYLEELEEEK